MGRRWGGGCPRGARSEDEGGKRGLRRGGVVRTLFGRRRVRQWAGGGRETGPTCGVSGARAGGVSGRGRRGGCGLFGARAGRPGKEKGGPSPDE
jgi:hypothetical protein